MTPGRRIVEVVKRSAKKDTEIIAELEAKLHKALSLFQVSLFCMNSENYVLNRSADSLDPL